MKVEGTLTYKKLTYHTKLFFYINNDIQIDYSRLDEILKQTLKIVLIGKNEMSFEGKLNNWKDLKCVQFIIDLKKNQEIDFVELKKLTAQNIKLILSIDRSQLQPGLLNLLWSYATKRLVTEFEQPKNKALKEVIMKEFIYLYCIKKGKDIFRLSDIKQVPALDFSDWVLERALNNDFLPNYPYRLVVNPSNLLEMTFNGNFCYVCGIEGSDYTVMHTHHLDARGHSRTQKGWDLDMHIVRLCSKHHRVLHGQEIDYGDPEAIERHKNGEPYIQIYKLDNLKELLTKRQLKNMGVKVK